jgi:hypothetical protein
MKKSVKILIGIGIVLLAYVLFNQFDASAPEGAFTIDQLKPVSLEKSNGFYWMMALCEPPDADQRWDEVLDTYQGILDPEMADGDVRRDWYYQHYRKQYEPYRRMLRFINQRKKDWFSFVKAKQGEIEAVLPKIKFMLGRYSRLVSSDHVEDFTHPTLWMTLYPHSQAFTSMSNLYTAMRVRDILDGNIEAGLDGLLRQLELSKKLVRTARLPSNARRGKELMKTCLDVINNWLNRPGCPRRVKERIAAALTPLSYEEWGTGQALKGLYVAISHFFDNLGIFTGRGYIFGNIGKVARIFLQKQRTKGYYFKYITTIMEYDKNPPYRWQRRFPRQRSMMRKAFWWFQNPSGKLLFSKFGVLHLSYDILLSHRTRARYGLTRLNAQLHLEYTGKEPVETVLKRLEAYKEPDPYTGRPYQWDARRKMFQCAWYGTRMASVSFRPAPVKSD